MTAPPLIVIAGATATGKTGLAIRLAEWLVGQGRPAEIISADSRQVFRGLDIGTAKVSAEERARVPHHGIDLVEPDQPFLLYLATTALLLWLAHRYVRPVSWAAALVVCALPLGLVLGHTGRGGPSRLALHR